MAPAALVPAFSITTGFAAAGLGRRLHELVARPDALQVADDHPGLVVRGQGRQKVDLVQVGLVADADELEQADVAVAAKSRMAVQSAPDWEMTEMPPAAASAWRRRRSSGGAC